MLQVIRNVVALLAMGFMLFSSTVNARSRYYQVDVDATHQTWYPGQTSSTYRITIDEPFATPRVPKHNPCRYGCIKPDMVCANGMHIPRVPDMFEKYQKLKQQRQQERLITAQTELLEAQTALLNQAIRANSPPYRPPSEATQRTAKQRLMARYTPQSKRSETRTTNVSETKPKRQATFSKRRLAGKSHSHKPSVFSRLASKLGLKKSHRCTADCVD